MKKYDYYRSVSSAGRKKRIRKDFSFSFVKILFLFVVCIGLCVAGYWTVRRAYIGISASRLGQWKPQDTHMSGIPAPIAQEMVAALQPRLQQPFSVQDAVRFQQQFQQQYPQLRRISVKRGLMSGKLNVSAEVRQPLAYFMQGEMIRLIDQDGTVYTDGQVELSQIPCVQFLGLVPVQLDKEVVDLIESSLKLKGQLKFEKLMFDLMTGTVQMQLPDESMIYFGQAKQLRQKARRAAQIEKLVQAQKLSVPHELDFTYFEDGKVFLRQKAH